MRLESAAPATPAGRSVECYRCGKALTVSPKAMSVFCPHCHQRLTLEDLHIVRPQPTRELMTCGNLIVEAGVQMHVVRAVATNVIVRGRVNGNVFAKGVIEIGRTGHIEGNVEAAQVIVEDGGVLRGRCAMRRREPEPAAAASETKPDAVEAASAEAPPAEANPMPQDVSPKTAAGSAISVDDVSAVPPAKTPGDAPTAAMPPDGDAAPLPPPPATLMPRRA